LPTVLFENSNINEFSRYLADSYPDQFSKNLSSAKVEKQSKEQELSGQMSINTLIQKNSGISSFAQSFKNSYKSNLDYRDKDIAIVGMSCRIAGARNSEEFWKILDQGKDMISEIPSDRWDWREYPDVRKWGSFIDGVAEFDSLFFGISPAEAIYMAPEQRLMMQYVWECIEDAGYNIDDLKGTNTGLFIGCGPSGYSNYLKSMPIEAYSATGMVPSVGPNRISFMMDWHGPSNPVETACSSALVALHRAVEAIRLGHCNHAIIGGVNLLLSPDGYISFTKSGMLCEDGRCKTFSAKANGYVRGEGVGMLMLKPLQAAIEDGNVIYAVVKGSAENHGGRSNSLTAPNPKSQAAVIKRAIEDADIDFSRFSYIECHGTGTPLGDPIEIEGLKMVASELLKNKDDKCNCKLGSIKSNIGHLEYAAGVVGLIKVILQIKHKKIVKSLHSDTINPYINLENTPFTIAQQASDWEIEPGKTRVAGVSSFGFGGVNAHVVLEEYSDKTISTQQNKDEDRSDPLAKLIILSAKSEESLIDYVTNFRNYIEKVDKSPITLKRIAYTLQVGRSEMPERLAFIVKSFDEWIELIDAFLASKGEIKDSRIYRGTIKSGLSNNNVELLDGKVNKDFIKQLLDSDKYDEIAQLWILGTKINWQHLYL
ncbi:MAG: polyketide synthase, partial [Prevotella sp.]|nr:polyketide synthase [Prevotella sp.]